MNPRRAAIQLAIVLLIAVCPVLRADDVKTPKPAPLALPLPAGVKLIPNIEYANVNGKSLLLDMYLPEIIDKPVPVILLAFTAADGSGATSAKDCWSLPWFRMAMRWFPSIIDSATKPSTRRRFRIAKPPCAGFGRMRSITAWMLFASARGAIRRADISWRFWEPPAM